MKEIDKVYDKIICVHVFSFCYKAMLYIHTRYFVVGAQQTQNHSGMALCFKSIVQVNIKQDCINALLFFVCWYMLQTGNQNRRSDCS